MIFAVMSMLTVLASQWQSAPAVDPVTPGYGAGVSAMYAGSIAGVPIIAGGANFPDIPVWEGGKKAFYSDIYMNDNGEWRYVAALPEPLAYGMTAQAGDDRLVFIGGCGYNGAIGQVTALERDESGAWRQTAFPSLPTALQEGAAATSGHVIYVAGGVAGGNPSSSLMALDTENLNKGWYELASMPEPLVQPVMVSSGGRLYLWGGCNPAAGTVSGRGYVYDPQTDAWTEIAGHPVDGTFTGAAAVALPDGRILCLGGVDRKVFTPALKYTGAEIREYQTRPVEAYRFQRVSWIYDPANDKWESHGEDQCVARAGASAVGVADGIWLIGGELKPGVRTPHPVFRPFQK